MNSDDCFKSRTLIKRRSQITDMEKLKEEIEDQVHVANGRDLLLTAEGTDLTEETKTSFTVSKIKVLIKWKVKKVPPGNK